MKKIRVWKLLIILPIIFVFLFLNERYGWRIFGFKYCENPEIIHISNVKVDKGEVKVTGDTNASVLAFVGYTYELKDDKLFIGLKYNFLLGFFYRIGKFDIDIKTDTEKVSQIFIKSNSAQKEIWNKNSGNVKNNVNVSNIDIISSLLLSNGGVKN